MENEQLLQSELLGPPFLTKYERARVIGLRALQLSLGAPAFVPVEEGKKWDPIEIAIKELESGVLPLSIRRTLPDGRYADIPVKELLKSSRFKEGNT